MKEEKLIITYGDETREANKMSVHCKQEREQRDRTETKEEKESKPEKRQKSAVSTGGSLGGARMNEGREADNHLW